jgi:very-short-patch-repair endonuclease
MQVASTDAVELHPTPRRSVDAGLFALAGPHNVVTTEALAAAGIGRNAIARRVDDGRLTRLFRGVYRVGPLEAKWTWEAAALLACGADAVLSRGAAAAVWGIRLRVSGPVDVTVTGRHRAGQAGIRVHHAALDPRDRTRHHDLCLTTPERTLLDLAATIGSDDLDRAVNEAQVLGLTTTTRLHSYLARSSSRRGTRALLAAAHEEPLLTRSELERRMLALIDRIGLPRPSTNVNILGHEVDFVWPAHRLIVETDGFGPHGTRRAFERDRRRDAQLQAAGYRVLRFTWWQLTNEPEVVAARLAAILALSGEPGRLRA